MNNKEKILAEFQKKVQETYGFSTESLGGKAIVMFCYHDIEQILNSLLPGENEINDKVTEDSKKFILALKHREISLMNAKLYAKKEKDTEEIEKIDRLLIPLRDNIKKLEKEDE